MSSRKFEQDIYSSLFEENVKRKASFPVKKEEAGKESSAKKKSAAPAKRVEKKVFVDSQEIPASYDTTRLTLIARDPYWIYANWEIAPSSIDKIRKKIGPAFEQSAYVLRMYDVTLKDFNGNNANNWFDVEISPHSNNWYVQLWKDCVTYCAALGIRTPEGKFFVLAQSNFVTTPRERFSGRGDVIWMEPAPAGSTGEGQQGQKPFVFIKRKRPAKGMRGPAEGQRRRRRIYLTADDIRAYYYNLFPLLKLIKSKRRGGGSFYGLSKKEIERLSQKDFENSLIHQGKFYRKIKLGASEELVLQGGASEQLKGGASEREEKKKNFFFEIGTELIVYGRTDPDAKVWLGDEEIKLRQDGTFSLRFSLPDGKIPLDFTAVSNDKTQQRKISTSVERTKTMYAP